MHQHLNISQACRRTHRRHKPQLLCAAEQQGGARAQGGAEPAPSQPQPQQPGESVAWDAQENHVPTPRQLRRQVASTDWLARTLGALSIIPWAAGRAFFADCWRVLRRLSAPSLPDAISRLGLILATSLVMIVVVTTIDSTFLWLYVSGARKLA